MNGASSDRACSRKSIVGKYCDHLPLYRQESIYWTRHKVWLPRQSLWDWVELAAQWLKPVYEEIRKGITPGGYVQIDETPVRYLAPGTGKSQQGYLWVCAKPKGDVIFHWKKTAPPAVWTASSQPTCMIRDILGFILGTAFGIWVLGFVVSGLRTGRIHHTDSTSVFVFRKHPIRFTLVAILFCLFGGMFLYAAIGRAIAIWHRLST